MEDTALVIALAMVLSMGAMTALADGAATDTTGTYTITIKNATDGSGKPVSGATIVDHTFSAYKLFDVRYVDDAANDTDTTVYGLDQGPHAYYLSTSSVFYTNTTARGLIEQYFTLTPLSGDSSQVLATPIVKDANGKLPTDDGYNASTAASIFGANEAYALAEALQPYFPSTADGTGVGVYDSSASCEKAVIDVSTKGAGYYLVKGDGKGYDETGDVAGDPVTAAIALTTTDPKAEIIAKLDAVKEKKEINETGRPKYNDKSVGDTVPYVVTTDIPNMAGYEKYFFILNDTLSKGLTLNDNGTIPNNTNYTDATKDVVDNGFEVKITWPAGSSVTAAQVPGLVTENGTKYLILPRVTDAAAAKSNTETRNYYVVKDGQSFKVVFHNFIQYKGNLIVDDQASDPEKTSGWSTYDYHNLGVDKSKVGTYYSPYDGATVTIKYSATVNDQAVIGNTGNVNTSSLTFSNNPNPDSQGTPDENTPDEPSTTEKDQTGETPESKTITYVTGIRFFKKDAKTGNALADAKFTLVGQNLKDIVETQKEYFRRAEGTETATHYLLQDGTYTTDDPTPDSTVGNTINKGTWRLYDRTGWDSFDTISKTVGEAPNTITVDDYFEVSGTAPWKKAFVKDTMKTWEEAVYVVDDTNGTYWLKKNGEFVSTEPAAADKADSHKYKAVTKSWAEMTMAEKAAATVSYTAETDTEGYISFTGLKSTTDEDTSFYKLTEIEAPDGYNMLKEPLLIKIKWTKPTKDTETDLVLDDDECVWTLYYKFESDTAWTPTNGTTVTDFANLFKIDIENQSGVELPSTGGIGTTIFYIVGAILVIGAGVVLITRRRMDA